jgi:hypothetical protein
MCLDIHAFQAMILKNVFRPLYMTVGNESIYIVDEKEIKVFSKKTLEYRHSIGKTGEGPGEFVGFPFPQILKDRVLVFSVGKISYFGKDGTLIIERKIPGGTQWVKQVNPKRYIGFMLKPAADDFYIAYKLLDENLRIMMELYRGRFILHRDRTRDLFELTFLDAHEGKIVYAHNDGSFAVDVLDPDGKVHAQIKRSDERIPFGEANKDRMFAFYENHPLYKESFQRMKERIVIPDYFPAILNCKVADNKIYIITFRVKDGENECFVYNLDGSLLRRTFIDLKGESPDKKDTPFTIFNGRLYQLVENPDDENWYLYVSDI